MKILGFYAFALRQSQILRTIASGLDKAQCVFEDSCGHAFKAWASSLRLSECLSPCLNLLKPQLLNPQPPTPRAPPKSV